MMKFYLDTEFNGFRGELISLALVSERLADRAPGADVVERYAARHINAPYNDWVSQHVLPVLRTPKLGRNAFKTAFHDFISRFPDCHIVCDWHADAEHFAALLDGREYGSSLDHPCTIRILKTPADDPPGSATPHNALDDARGLRDWCEARKI